MNNPLLAAKLQLVPKQPGCYLWLDHLGQIIYIGKAKNLFDRTHNYFASGQNYKTQKLVSEIADINFFVTRSENEALILEANLVKAHKPKYNVLLRENSGYPYFFLTNEQVPQLLYTKNHDLKKPGKYFGPFATSYAKPYELYKLLLQLMPWKPCTHQKNGGECFKCELNKRSHLNWEGLDDQDFKSLSKLLSQILAGDLRSILDHLKAKELAAKNTQAYEQAHKYYVIYQAIQKISNHQLIQINATDVDIIGFHQNQNELTIVIFGLSHGKLLTKHEVLVEYVNEWKQALINYLQQYYQVNTPPKNTYIAFHDEQLALLHTQYHVNWNIPQQGKYWELLNLAHVNAIASYQKLRLQNNSFQQRQLQAHNQFQQLLNLNQLHRIEMFDISQLFGTHPVGAMVVFVDGIAHKHHYRKYVIKAQEDTSDVACLKQVLMRRYQKLNSEQDQVDLILVDGGVQQYHVIQAVLAELKLTIAYGALVKNDQHATSHLIYQEQLINLSDHPQVLHYLANIQTTVHNYAINFFRKKNLTSQLNSLLNQVHGLGQKRIQKLLSHYDSIKQLQQVSLEELSQIIPYKIALNLQNHLQQLRATNATLATKVAKIT